MNDNIWSFLVAYRLPGSIMITVIFLIVTAKVLDLELSKIVGWLIAEFKELLSIKWTVESLNALAILTILLLSLLILGANGLEWLARLLVDLGKTQAATVAEHSDDAYVILVGFGIAALASQAITAKMGRRK